MANYKKMTEQQRRSLAAKYLLDMRAGRRPWGMWWQVYYVFSDFTKKIIVKHHKDHIREVSARAHKRESIRRSTDQAYRLRFKEKCKARYLKKTEPTRVSRRRAISAKWLMCMRRGEYPWQVQPFMRGIVCEKVIGIIKKNMVVYHERRQAARRIMNMRSGRAKWSLSGSMRQVSRKTKILIEAKMKPRTETPEEREKRLHLQRIYNKRHVRPMTETRRLQKATSEQKRKAAKLGLKSDPASIIVITLKRTKHVCYWCGKRLGPTGWHMDHLIPFSKGGTHTAANIVKSCAFCNESKSGTHPNDWYRNKQALLL